MKKIIVYQEGAENIELFDDTDGNLESFAQTLSNVLKASTVSIINTSGTSLIVRPSKIISILVKDHSDKTVKVIPKGKKKEQKPKAKVDIITDV